MDAAAAREREQALLAQVQDAREHALQLQADAAKREVEGAKREAAQQLEAAKREAALQVEAATLREEAAKREAALQLEAAGLREEAARLKAAVREEALRREMEAQRREMEALRASLGSVQGAVVQALAAERARAQQSRRRGTGTSGISVHSGCAPPRACCACSRWWRRMGTLQRAFRPWAGLFGGMRRCGTLSRTGVGLRGRRG